MQVPINCIFLGEQENITDVVRRDNITNGSVIPSMGNSPAYGLVLFSGTVVLIFLIGGTWLVLYCIRPDILQAMAVALSGGFAVSTEKSSISLLEFQANYCYNHTYNA